MRKNMNKVRQQADAVFKKDDPAHNAAQARQTYEAAGAAIREKTERLKSLRLAKEAAENRKG